MTAYSPMGHGASYFNDSIAAIREPIVQDIAAQYGVSEAQVVLRWNNTRGVSVIPKSNHLERIKQNLDIFAFEMTVEDMEKMKNLDRHLRFNVSMILPFIVKKSLIRFVLFLIKNLLSINQCFFNSKFPISQNRKIRENTWFK